jgi:hypothetical protein
MKTFIAGTLFVTAVVASAGAASADPMTIEYVVQRKPLVAAMSGTDTLNVLFYSDPKCETLSSSVAVAANSPAVHFERVKSQRIGRLKSADLVRINAIIEAAPSSASFVRVEGPGVTPAKAICQPQGGGSGIRFIDTTVTDTILQIAGVDSLEEVRVALEKGPAPDDRRLRAPRRDSLPGRHGRSARHLRH